MPAVQPSHKNISPAWFLTAPLDITHGAGSYLYAEDGRRYLDFTCGYGVTSTGHCHPRVEFVGPDGSPNPQASEAIKWRCLEGGVLISRCGPHSQTLRLAPPLTISEAEVDQFLQVFRSAVDAVSRN